MLVFYSDGGHKENKSIDDQLLSVAGKSSRISYLSLDPSGDLPWFKKWVQDRKSAGFNKTYFFPVTNSTGKQELIEGFASEILFLPGGNTFEILHKLKKLKLTDSIKKFYHKKGILAGLSAGAMIMTPTIRIAALVGDDRKSYQSSLEGLNLAPFEIFPHFKSRAADIKKLTDYSKGLKAQVFAISDGCGIIKTETSLCLHGNVVCFNRGKVIELNNQN